MFLVQLAKGIRAEQIVEVGCFAGLTTRTLAEADPDWTIHAIDHFQGSDDLLENVARHGGPLAVYGTFCRNLREWLFRRVFVHVGTSRQVAMVWPFAVDLVFIDADHTYEAVKEDIELWKPHVRPGGLLCGHDYRLFEGVTQAVDEIRPDEVKGFVWVKQM